MAAFNKFEQFVEDLTKKVHNLSSDALTIALSNAANPPSGSADAVLADITTVSTANLDDKTPTITSCEQTSGTVKLILVDLTMTSTGGSTGPFQYVILYNDTPTSPTDPLIGYYNYGSEITLAQDESLTIDFDGTNGALSIA